MDWILLIIFLIAVYAAVAYYIHSRKLWEDHITFYGPIMAIKTSRIGFFDKFAAFRRFFRIYGSAGVIAVIIVSIFITFMLFVSVRYTLLVQPEPTGIYKPQNILLLPGINEYVPSTLAVWLAFIITIGVHEFGHAILCRVENIKVKTMGALIAVIPLGFFVEPDEEELDSTKGMAKIRMFGAGITNNLVVGFSCFVLVMLMIGLVVPSTTQPTIHGIYSGYPAELAGVPQDSVIQYIEITNTSPQEDNKPVVLNPETKSVWSSNDTGALAGTQSLLNLTTEREKYFLGIPDPSPAYLSTIDLYLKQRYSQRSYAGENSTSYNPFLPVSLSHKLNFVTGNTTSGSGHLVTTSVRLPVSSREQVSTLLNATIPGDRIILGVEKKGILKDYQLTLAAWPADVPNRTSGFMGVEYYDGTAVLAVVRGLLSPVGFFQFLIIPFANDPGSQYLRILAFDIPDTGYYQTPFWGFWDIVHLLFWSAWINLNVGIFNAIPMIPLDGGYIFKEGVDRLLDRRGLMKYSGYVSSAVSYLMLIVLVSLITLPYLLHI